MFLIENAEKRYLLFPDAGLPTYVITVTGLALLAGHVHFCSDLPVFKRYILQTSYFLIEPINCHFG